MTQRLLRPGALDNTNGLRIAIQELVDAFNQQLRAQTKGEQTFIGDGVTEEFSWPHGLGSTPAIVLLTPRSPVAVQSGGYLSWDMRDVTLHLTSPTIGVIVVAWAAYA